LLIPAHGVAGLCTLPVSSHLDIQKESAVQFAAAVPAEEHPHHCHHDDRNPCDHGASAALVLCVHQEETDIVSGSLLSPSFQDLLGVWTNVVSDLSADPRFRKRAQSPVKCDCVSSSPSVLPIF
jgi:hypothetical protein